MMKVIYFFAITLLMAITTPTYASNDKLLGIWQTEKSDTNGYLHVEFNLCDQAACGVIVAAFNEKNEPGHDYAHLGKTMVWNMYLDDDERWTGGKIWDPEKDKTYKSKMKLDGETLVVSGCIAFICRSQQWTRVE